MRKRQAGFTLLEALVALVVLGLVMTVAAAAMGTLGTARTRVSDIADRAQQLSLVRDVLRRQVSRALPLTDAGDETYILTATADRFVFALADAPLPGRGGLAMAELTIDGNRLLYAQTRPGQPRYQTVLAEGDFSFHLSYRGDDPRQGWVSDWLDGQRWPRLVRLDITAAGREMPSIIVPVRADTDRGCVLALGEGFCRDHQH